MDKKNALTCHKTRKNTWEWQIIATVWVRMWIVDSLLPSWAIRVCRYEWVWERIFGHSLANVLTQWRNTNNKWQVFERRSKKKLQQQSTIKQTLQLSVIRVINGPNALALCDIIYLFEYKCQSGALISFNKSPDFIYFSITLALSSSFLPQCFRRPQIVAAYSTLAYHFWRFRRFLPMQSRNWTGVTRRFVRMASGMWRVITMV